MAHSGLLSKAANSATKDLMMSPDTTQSIFGLKDAKVLITGASRGIGRAIAIAFATQGANLALHYNTGEGEAQQLAQELEPHGVSTTLIKENLLESDSATRLVEKAGVFLGGLDVLINNAGSLIARQPLTDVSSELLESATLLNYLSVVRITQQALPLLSQSPIGGSVVNVGSIAARTGGGGGSAHYGAAKAAIEGFTRSVAKEFAPSGIRANVIAPGVIETDFHSNTDQAMMASFAKSIPLGRLGTPEDCVGAVLLLASPTLGSFITGHVLSVNGGQLMT